MDNKEIIGNILKSTIDVISRRTSEAYASVVIRKAIRDLENKYKFLQYVTIRGKQFTELYDVIEIDDEINDIDIKDLSKAANEFLNGITNAMGKSAGYFFIKEIKEDLPLNYEPVVKDLGIDFDLIQLQFITNYKIKNQILIKNSEILKNTLMEVYTILDKDLGQFTAYKTLNELVKRLATTFDAFKFVKINDVSAIQRFEPVVINQDVDLIESNLVGTGLQRCIQELNNFYVEKKDNQLIDRLTNKLNSDLISKLKEIGVNLDVVKLNQGLIFKKVLDGLVDILSDSTSESYAILVINGVIRKYERLFDFLKDLKIDFISKTNGYNIIIPPALDNARESELGRSIQMIIENIIKSLGENAGKDFVDKYKKRIGKAYILRIEDMGVNLHLVELRQNLLW